LKEYLATGRPVVASDLPANRPWADCMDVVSTPGQFAEAVRLRLQTGLPPEQRAARGRLASEGWDGKARLFERWGGGLRGVGVVEPSRDWACEALIHLRETQLTRPRHPEEPY